MIRIDRRSVAAFTLVQLMVVLAVIAVLMALITAAVQKVRQSADFVVCVNNMKQIAMGITQYHEAFDRFPVYNGISTPVKTATGFDMSQSANRKSVYGSYLLHSLPYFQEKDVYNAIRAETDQYTNTGQVWKVIPGTPAIPAIPAIPGTPYIPGRPAIEATPGTPPIPGKPGTPDIPATPGGPLLVAPAAAIAATYDYTGLVYRNAAAATYDYTGLVYNNATPTVYDYTGLEYRNATPPTYDLWNSSKQLVDYYVADPTSTNGAVIWIKYSKWVPDQYVDPWSNKPAGYYRISDSAGPLNPPVKTPAQPAGYYRMSDGSGPVNPPIKTPYQPAGYYRIVDGIGPITPPLLTPYIPAVVAVYGPPGPPTPFIPGTPPTPDIPGTPPTPYIPAVPETPAKPGVPGVPGVPAGPPTLLYTSTFKSDYRGRPYPIFRCPSDPSVLTDPEINTPGLVYTATMGNAGGWTSTNYLANWNVLSIFNPAVGYKSPPSTLDQVSDGLSNTVLLGEAYAWCDGKGRTAFMAWHETDPAGGPNGGLAVGGVHNFGLTYALSNNYITAGNRPKVGVLAPNGYPNPYIPPPPSTVPELIFEFQVTPKALSISQCPANTDCCIAFSVQSGHAGGLNAATCDGAVHTLRREVSLDVWRALLLPRDGKSFTGDW